MSDNINALTTGYFSLVNPTTGFAMTADGDGANCANGMNILLQPAVPGSVNQLFYTKNGGDEITSLMCPNNAISISNASACDANTSKIHPKTRDGTATWKFNNDSWIESMSQCASKVIDVRTILELTD